jgi:hypothetical protein
MEHQIHARTFNPRFPPSARYVTFRTGKDPVVDSAVEPNDAALEAEAREHQRPRASDWLWRPWYAKFWWTAIVVYWAGKVGSIYSPLLDEIYTSAFAGFLNVAFFPPLALMLLGLGFARAWFAWSDWEFVEPTHEQMFPKRSVGGMRDPASDPLDPRSGLHWQHFHRRR